MESQIGLFVLSILLIIKKPNIFALSSAFMVQCLMDSFSVLISLTGPINSSRYIYNTKSEISGKLTKTLELLLWIARPECRQQVSFQFSGSKLKGTFIFLLTHLFSLVVMCWPFTCINIEWGPREINWKLGPLFNFRLESWINCGNCTTVVMHSFFVEKP